MGAKIALRAPTTTGTSPSAIRCHCQCRSASLRWLCSTATRAETAAKPLDRLRREADLRHQHDRLAAEMDHLLDRLDVDLGLAAAGHAVNEYRPCRREFSASRIVRSANSWSGLSTRCFSWAGDDSSGRNVAIRPLRARISPFAVGP